MKRIFAWLQSRDGATAVEYGLIMGGISLVIMAAVFLMGDDLQTIFSTMASKAASVASKI